MHIICELSFEMYLLAIVKVVCFSGNGKSSDRRKAACSHLHSNVYSFTREDDGCFNCISGVFCD